MESTGKQNQGYPALFGGAFCDRAQLVLQILGKQPSGFGQGRFKLVGPNGNSSQLLLVCAFIPAGL